MGFPFDLFPIMFFLVFAMVFGTFIMTAVTGISRWSKNNNSPRLTVDATVIAKRGNTTRHHHHGAGGHVHHTYNIHLGTGRGKFPTEVFQLGIDEIVVVCLIHIVSPYGFSQHLFLHQVSTTVDKIEKDVILLAPQVEHLLTYADAMFVGVDSEISYADVQVASPLATTDDTTDAGVKFSQVEGFGQVIVGSQFKAGHLVVQRVFGRDDDDTLLLLQLLQVHTLALITSGPSLPSR